MILAYYDKNPQSQIESNTNYSASALLSSYCSNQSILSKLPSPIFPSVSLLNIPNITENFVNTVLVKKEKTNSIHMKYALL